MKISLLGTGLMGSALAARLLSKKYSLSVYNRTRSKTDSLKKQGAHVASSAQEAVASSEIVLLAFTDFVAIEEVLSALTKKDIVGKIFFQMGTIAPLESLKLQEAVTRRGGQYAECPVLGSIKEALAGKLFILFGGDQRLFKRAKKFLKVFDPSPRHIGPVGKAALLKLSLNHLIAAHAVSFSVSLGMVKRGGIKEDVFMDILRRSSLYTPMFDKKLPLWSKRKYTPANFFVKHLLKDVNLILQEVRRLKINDEEVKAIRHLIELTSKTKYRYQDYASVYETINKAKA